MSLSVRGLDAGQYGPAVLWTAMLEVALAFVGAMLLYKGIDRVRDQAEVKVETAYNRLEQTEQMVAVSQELLAARQEARRVSAQGLERGTYLRSQTEAAVAQESEAQTQLLQSKLEYAQAQDELNEAIGQTPN
jgi:outer membrane protein TolC